MLPSSTGRSRMTSRCWAGRLCQRASAPGGVGQHATAHSSWLGHIVLVSAEAATEACLQNFCPAQLLLIFMHNHCKCMAGLMPTKHADEATCMGLNYCSLFG